MVRSRLRGGAGCMRELRWGTSKPKRLADFRYEREPRTASTAEVSNEA